MAEFLAYEEYAQILMFVIYKNQNEDVIEEIILNSQIIFDGVGSCDLDKDVEFINRLNLERPEVSLPSDDVGKNRREQRRAMEEQSHEPYAIQDGKVRFSADLDEGAKLQHAFKAMQIMGRIIRNFPAHLGKDTKLQLAISTFDLGLRTLTTLYSGVQHELPAAQSAIRQAIKARTNRFDEMQLDRRADAVLSYIMTGCAIVIVGTVATAIGSPRLRETYRAMSPHLAMTPGTTLIRMAVELDHFREIPVQTLNDLRKRYEKNHVAYQVLRYLVWKRVGYLPIENRKIKQELLENFEIRTKSAPLLPPFMQ